MLDPFAGAFTTLLAAQRTGRKAIGIEIEEYYCERGAERLSADGIRSAADRTRVGAKGVRTMIVNASVSIDTSDLTNEQIERLVHHVDISRRVFTASVQGMAKGVRKYSAGAYA